MAKDPFKARLSSLTSDIEKRQGALGKLQEQLRADPYNGDLRRQVQSAKIELVPLLDERAEVSRAISRLAGGKQHRVDP